MAEEDETPSADGTGASRTKRPPVTIDLEAEQVRSDPPQAEPAKTESEPAPVADTAATPAAEPGLVQRLLPIAAAAVAGGIVGGIVAGFLLAPHTDTINEASTDQRLLILGSRLDALEQKAGEAGGASVDPQRIASLEEAVKKLEAAPAVTSGAPAELEPLDEKLAALAARLDQIEKQPQQAPAPAVDLSPLQQQLGALDSRLTTIEQHPPSDPATEAAARTIALTALRQAALGDKGFAAELKTAEALKIDAGALAPLADQGAPSLAALQASFPATAEAVRAASRKVDPEAGLFDRLTASASALVSVKPAGPVPGTSATAIVSRMEADVAKGDLAAALAEGDALDAAVKPAVAGWAEAARRRVAIDQALAALANTN